MSKAVGEYITDMEGRRLAVSAVVLSAIKQALFSRMSTHTRVASLIRQDPALTLQVMRHVQLLKRYDGAPPLLAPEACVSLMGTSPLGEYLGRQPAVTRGAAMPSHVRMMHRAQLAVLLVRDWATQQKDGQGDELALATLGCFLGEAVMRSVDLPLWAECEQRQSRVMEGWEELEYQSFGFTLDELSAAMLSAWDLPLLQTEHSPDRGSPVHYRRRLMVHTAWRLSQAISWSWDHPAVMELVETAALMNQRTLQAEWRALMQAAVGAAHVAVPLASPPLAAAMPAFKTVNRIAAQYASERDNKLEKMRSQMSVRARKEAPASETIVVSRSSKDLAQPTEPQRPASVLEEQKPPQARARRKAIDTSVPTQEVRKPKKAPIDTTIEAAAPKKKTPPPDAKELQQRPKPNDEAQGKPQTTSSPQTVATPPDDPTVDIVVKKKMAQRRYLTADAERYNTALTNLRLESAGNRQEVINLVLDGAHWGLGLNRVAFIMRVGQGGKEMVFRFRRVWGDVDSLEKLKVPVTGKGLFARLLTRPQGLWLNNQNHDRLWPHIPPMVRNGLGVDQFYLLPVHLKGKPVGFFYADRYRAQEPLDQKSYDQFRSLCLSAIPLLEK